MNPSSSTSANQAGSSSAPAFEAWLRAQRDVLDNWLSASVGEDARKHIEEWWQSVAQRASPQAQHLAQQLAALGPAFLAGAATSLNELFGTQALSSGVFFDAAPVGFFREHHERWQGLARALEDQRRLAQQMSGLIAQVHGDALERLAERVAQLEQAGERVTDTRRLYDLWIECGERAFARIAHQESYGRLQGELTQAIMHVRAAQQAMAEYLLKQLDLPTRSELNSVHRALRSLRERIEQLEAKR